MSRILVLDDDPLTVNAFGQVLAGCGHDAVVATSAEQAFHALADGPLDAIILDLWMPFINGLGFLYRLRSHPLHRNTPVVVVTGDTTLRDEVLAELKELGAQVHFKPVDLRKLLVMIQTLIDRGALSRALADDPAFMEFHRGNDDNG